MRLNHVFLMIAVLTYFPLAQAIPSNQELAKALHLDSISSEYILINVWSPFCEPCGKEIEQLNQVLSGRNMTPEKLTIIGFPAEGRKKEIQEFIAHFKPNYQQIILDNEARPEALQFAKIPYTILLDQERKIIKQWTGPVSTNIILLQLSAPTQKE